jgi:hypothetical protein
MGNPGVRLLVPAARVRDVRTMGAGKHARFSLHSGGNRALGVAFGRSSLGVGEEQPVDAAVRLEVNRWNGSVEPRVVLRELYPREEIAGQAAELEAAWWARFEAELKADPGALAPAVPEIAGERRTLTPVSSPAAVIAELVSCGGEAVLAVGAAAARRAALASDGVVLADPVALEAEPELACGFEHVVLVDPPAFRHLERLAGLPCAEGGFLHAVWGEAERRFALAMLDRQLARRPALIELFRDLREGGAEPFAALRGSGRHPRGPEAAARCFRVLAELELVQGEPREGGGAVGVVSSRGTDLERSAAFRAYGDRHQGGVRFLERRKKP